MSQKDLFASQDIQVSIIITAFQERRVEILREVK